MRRYFLSLGLVVIAAFLAACDSEPAPDPVQLEIEATGTLTYDKGNIVVPENAEVTIDFSNGAIIEHDLVIASETFSLESEAKNAVEEDPSIVLAETDVLGPNEAETITVTFDEPGVYQYFCSVDGHFATMNGTITVEG